MRWKGKKGDYRQRKGKSETLKKANSEALIAPQFVEIEECPSF